MQDVSERAIRDSNFNAAYETPYDKRGYPRAGEYWYDPEPYGPGGGVGSPKLVEQVGVTTIWLQNGSGSRFAMNFAEMRSTWKRCDKPQTTLDRWWID